MSDHELTPEELATLEEWKFDRDYQENQGYFDFFAKRVYLDLKNTPPDTITIDELTVINVLGKMLRQNPFFVKILKHKGWIHMSNRPLVAYYGNLFAKLIVNRSWQWISS